MSEGWYKTSALQIMQIDYAAKTVKEIARYPMNPVYFGEGATYFPKDGLIY